MPVAADLRSPLLTDLYQLTMASGYWSLGMADHEAVFHLFYRRPPFKGGYAIAAGLEAVIDYLKGWRFTEEDRAFLATLTGNDGQPLFPEGFLQYLVDTPFSCEIDAVPEGTVVAPHAPLIRVKGPLIQGQLIETPLLTMVNFQTLIATKSARICAAAQGEPVLEFGLRRAQGVDGGLSASRAAYVGGCAATSNVLAGRVYGIPVKGTHAHSWVMAFEDEVTAFESYARAMPNNCVFLVDTYDTVEGVKRAIEVGKALRANGHEMVGVRLDSGDLATLSIEARRLLDEAGFPDAAVVASNDLDEYNIARLKADGARIGVWGVGTRLATAYDQPALGGVYKLAAIRGAAEAGAEQDWRRTIKLSEQAIKVSNPGILQVRRFTNDAGAPLADVIYDELDPPAGLDSGAFQMVNPATDEGVVDTPPGAGEDLLVPVFRDGKAVYDTPPIDEIRDHALRQLAALPAEIAAVDAGKQGHGLPWRLEAGLASRKAQMIADAGALAETGEPS
ncbi:MAG: nicotinate phosphoribosyltransferase [Bradymonadia bacterium]